MARQLRQARAVLRAAGTYLRRDLPEILFPSSIPDPPGLAHEPNLLRRDWHKVLWRACKRYAETWDAKKMRAERAAREGEATVAAERRREQEGLTLSEEFAAAAKGGSKALKPFLSTLYQTRARAYRDAVQQFVEGYKQGFQQAMKPEVPPGVEGEMSQAKAQAAGDDGDRPEGEQAQAAATGAAGPEAASAAKEQQAAADASDVATQPGAASSSGSGEAAVHAVAMPGSQPSGEAGVRQQPVDSTALGQTAAQRNPQHARQAGRGTAATGGQNADPLEETGAP